MLDRDLRLNDRVKTRGGAFGRVSEVREGVLDHCTVSILLDNGAKVLVGHKGNFRLDFSSFSYDIVEIIPDASTPVLPLECRPWGDNWKAVRVGSPKQHESCWCNSLKEVISVGYECDNREVYVILERTTPQKPKTHPGPPHLKGWWIVELNGAMFYLSKEEPQRKNGNWETTDTLTFLWKDSLEMVNLKTLPDFGDLPPEQRKIQIGEESE